MHKAIAELTIVVPAFLLVVDLTFEMGINRAMDCGSRVIQLLFVQTIGGWRCECARGCGPD